MREGAIAGTLRLTVTDRRRPLAVAGAAASSRAGQADLPILRLDCLLRSDVPRTSRSKRLTDYPKDLLASPLDVCAARPEVRPGGARLQPAAGVGEPGAASVVGGVTGSFQGLATRDDGSPLVVLTAFLAALARGPGTPSRPVMARPSWRSTCRDDGTAHCAPQPPSGPRSRPPTPPACWRSACWSAPARPSYRLGPRRCRYRPLRRAPDGRRGARRVLGAALAPKGVGSLHA